MEFPKNQKIWNLEFQNYFRMKINKKNKKYSNSLKLSKLCQVIVFFFDYHEKVLCCVKNIIWIWFGFGLVQFHSHLELIQIRPNSKYFWI